MIVKNFSILPSSQLSSSGCCFSKCKYDWNRTEYKFKCKYVTAASKISNNTVNDSIITVALNAMRFIGRSYRIYTFYFVYGRDFSRENKRYKRRSVRYIYNLLKVIVP